MPTNAQIAEIEVAFAEQYGLDLPGIRKDTETLKKLVAETPANANLINSVCYPYDGKEAFVPDLEATALSAISPDARLSPRRVELNLDESLKYLQSCLQIRQQYGEAARLRNDTRFKGEEFVRLDAVHLQEVDAGLYKLPWQEAAAERAGLETAVAQSNSQQSIPEEMMRDGAAGNRYSAVLSNSGIDSYVKSTAFIVKNVAYLAHDPVGIEAASTARYRSGIELATWLETLAAAKSNVAQLTAKLSIALCKEQYFRKDEGFRTQRAAISRQLAWLQIAEHCRQGSELNYNEKMEKLKTLFNANLRCLIERVRVLGQGLKDNYSIDLPLDTPATGSIVDNVSVWLVAVQDQLSKFKRTQRLTISSKWNGGDITISPNGNGRMHLFTTEVNVEKTDMPSDKALLRGVGFEYVGNNGRPITLKVLPPSDALSGSGPSALFFGRVCAIAPNRELPPQHADAFWNGSPTGTWKIEGTFDQAAGSIDSIVMHMWVVSA
jgi:hypothetical protein